MSVLDIKSAFHSVWHQRPLAMLKSPQIQRKTIQTAVLRCQSTNIRLLTSGPGHNIFHVAKYFQYYANLVDLGCLL